MRVKKKSIQVGPWKAFPFPSLSGGKAALHALLAQDSPHVLPLIALAATLDAQLHFSNESSTVLSANESESVKLENQKALSPEILIKGLSVSFSV